MRNWILSRVLVGIIAFVAGGLIIWHVFQEGSDPQRYAVQILTPDTADQAAINERIVVVGRIDPSLEGVVPGYPIYIKEVAVPDLSCSLVVRSPMCRNGEHWEEQERATPAFRVMGKTRALQILNAKYQITPTQRTETDDVRITGFAPGAHIAVVGTLVQDGLLAERVSVEIPPVLMTEVHHALVGLAVALLTVSMIAFMGARSADSQDYYHEPDDHCPTMVR